MVYDMPSYTLAECENHIVDHHIPTRTNKNITELYFESINLYVNKTPNNKTSYLETKLRKIDIMTFEYRINFGK